jgi:small subunit ribosomal protein S15
MFLEDRNEIVNRFAKHDKDTGSSQVQIALLSHRIRHLTEHFKTHKHDHHGRRGLLKLVAQRRRHLNYLKKSDFSSYKTILNDLGLRK